MRWLLLSFALVTIPATVCAQDAGPTTVSPDGSVPTRPNARETTEDTNQIALATRLFKAEQYESALSMFRSLRAASTDAPDRIRLQWNIARCLEQLGRNREALRIFQAYDESVSDPVRSSRARAKIELLRDRVFGSISVTCGPGGPVEGQVAGSKTTAICPTVLKGILPGSVVIEGIAADGRKTRSVVTVVAGKSVTAQLLFTPTAPRKMAETSSKWPWYVGGAVVVVTAGILTAVLVNRSDPTAKHSAKICLGSQCD